MLLYFYKSKFILRMLNVKLLIRERRGRYGSFFTLLYGTRRHTGATYERECMSYLQDILGYSFEVARGVLGLAVARGYITVSANAPVKTYGMQKR